jgi:hypothetical protein
MADAMQVILQADFECADPSFDKQANQSLRWLLRIGDQDWVPVALRLLTQYAERACGDRCQIGRVGKLAAILWLNRFDINNRIDRYGKVLEEIANDQSKSGALPSLLTSIEEKKSAAAAIAGDVYNLSPATQADLRLASPRCSLSSGEATYDFDTITVEHILPQTPDAHSQWMEWWPDPTVREQSIHQLGNLALLNRRQNSAALNWDFATKKEKYYQRKTGGSPFQITSRVLKEPKWTPDVFAKHQGETVAKLKEVWGL